MSGETCRQCDMPLAYDAFFWGGGRARSDGLCSYCADPHRHKDQLASLEGRAWMLGMLLRVHRLGRGFARGLAWTLSGVAALGSEKLARLARLVDSIPSKPRGDGFDALVLYSGGKDSTYMLRCLAQRGVRLCAWMLDQNYQSPAAIENAHLVCGKLNVPLVVDRLDKGQMDELFQLGMSIGSEDRHDLVAPAMTYGSACWPCFAVLLARASLFCADRDVSFCFLGTQKGQNQLAMQRRPELAACRLPLLGARAGEFVGPLRAAAAERGLGGAALLETCGCRTVVVPFYEFVPRPPREELMRAIAEVGWRMPDGTGSCSSNCLLNEFGRQTMRARFGFDLYQVANALERRLGSTATGVEHERPELDEALARRGADMLGLSDTERRQIELAHAAKSSQ